MSYSVFDRAPTTQDISWLIDLDRNNRLDISPPYQRRSVWTRKDKQFFLDTIFRGYPSPAVFLHKTHDGEGIPTYHVVDGKQRIETILSFVDNKIRMSPGFGDVRLDGKLWKDLQGEPQLQSAFWNYQITVEMVKVDSESTTINEVFDRLNRNSRKLTRQELRHARFEGWFVSLVEEESKLDFWHQYGVSSSARERRMLDVQTISELFFTILENKLLGFDQNGLDGLYAKYDDTSSDTEEPLELGVFRSEGEFLDKVGQLKNYINEMNSDGRIETYTKANIHLYTLWAALALDQKDLPPARTVRDNYIGFMAVVDQIKGQESEDLDGADNGCLVTEKNHSNYFRNATGASTELPQRQARHDALCEALYS